MKKIIILIIAVILLVLICALGTYKILTMPVSKSIEEKEIVIPMGCGASQIGAILKENNLIKSKLAFKMYVKLHKVSNFQAGTYYLKEVTPGNGYLLNKALKKGSLPLYSW